VSGAKRNTDPYRQRIEETDEERLDRLEREEAEEAEAQDRMEELEAKTLDAKREMDVADALDEIRTRNARLERADRDGGVVFSPAWADEEAEERKRQEREDEDAARAAFAKVKISARDDEQGSEGSGVSGRSTPVVPAAAPDGEGPTVSKDAAPSFKRQVKNKKDHAALLGIKKKSALV